MSEKVAAAPEMADPAALSLALAGASRAKADAYLDDQRHHLHEQLKQIHLDVWEKKLGVLLRLATLVVGLAAASGVGLLVWDAAHADGLIIEPFNVPPDLAAKGMTGEVVAAKVLDELVALQSQTSSGRAAKSYSNSWGEHGIKLEIPETGISLNELDDWLREKLGHESRLSGELVRSDDGIALTARSDGGSVSVTGAEKDVNALVVQLAEQVYRTTQPFRYTMYLAGKNRADEALPILRELSLHGDHDDSMWAYNRWAVTVGSREGVDAGLKLLEQAIAQEPESVGAYDNRGSYLGDRGLWEKSLANYRVQMTVLTDGKQTYVPPARIPIFRQVVEARTAFPLGAYREAEPIYVQLTHTGYPGYNAVNIRTPLIRAQIGAHELGAARAMLAEMETLLPPPAGAPRPGATVLLDMRISQAGEDWAGVLALRDQMSAARGGYNLSVRKTSWGPVLAVAEAHLSHFAEAERELTGEPADCYPCLIAHAQVAQLQNQPARADLWFARAAAQGPSLPFAEQEWGQALLTRHQPDAAIEKFKLANIRGPHFADPLEGWGEALMAKNQSHLALTKFEEANKYAPNWGRLHLRWGEALAYSGRPDEARAQFARAATLDLTPTEKAELAGMGHV